MSAMSNARLLKMGQLEELKQKEYKLRVQVDTIVKTMIASFDPMDRDMKYIDSIEPKRMKIYAEDIQRKIHELRGVVQEIKDYKDELDLHE